MTKVSFLLLLTNILLAGCSRKSYNIQTMDKNAADSSVKTAANTNKTVLSLSDTSHYIKLSDSAIEEMFSPPKVRIDYSKASAMQCYKNAVLHPAGYRQICSYQPFVPYQKEFTPDYISTGEFYISNKQYKAIRAKRDSTIAIIKKDTNEFNQYSLSVIIDLNAVELFPDLIEKAKSLTESSYRCIEKGKDWSPLHLNGDTVKYEADWPCYYTTHTLGNILLTITTLLHQEGYSPLLSSGIIKSGEAVSMKKKNVDMILGWAQDYLKDTPESVKKEAYKRMKPLD